MIFGMIHGGAVQHIARDMSETSVCGRYVLTLGESNAPLCKSCARITGHVIREVPTTDAQSMISGCQSDHNHIDPAVFTNRKHNATMLAMYRDVLNNYANGAENDACWIGTLMLVLDRPKLTQEIKTAELGGKLRPGSGDGLINPKLARTNGITDAQKSFIESLLTQLDEMEILINGENAISFRLFSEDEINAFDKKRASKLIESLKIQVDKRKSAAIAKRTEARKVETKTVAPKLADGVYVLNGQYIKVKHNQMGTRQYGVVFNSESGEWDYTPGITSKLTDDNKLTPELAKEFGDLYGACCVCSRLLTDEESIRLGIGPVCRGKLGW